ncbi:MAG TPA: glycosyl hydrolase family 28-related protein [Chloroflexota bacterium]|nr:glycosyl hydrolase family 28-related protein [Chloroflexota bacterium]
MTPTRRAAGGLLLAAGVASVAGATAGAGRLRALRAQEPAPAPPADPLTDPLTVTFPALGLKINTPAPGAAPEVDLRAAFGAAGDGVQDDRPAFLALAAAVNEGRVPAGAVVRLPAGRYRVSGDDPVVFRRPVVLRGDGPEATVVRPEFTRQRSVFLRAEGQGMYAQHSASLYDGRQSRNTYPNAPYSPLNVGAEHAPGPRRGDTALTLLRPELFEPGDQVYLLCDDAGPQVTYGPRNTRLRQFLLKQHAAVATVEGERLRLDVPLRDDFGGAGPRLYRWTPLRGFGIEHLSVEDGNDIADTEAATTFKAVQLDGVLEGWVWDVHFRDNTSIPLSVGRSRRVVVSECLFDGARHVGGGGNGYLPELYMSDDCLVEYCTSVAGRHALICNWTCWGNVFRYNRLQGTPNTETHGEYSVENLYLRNDARTARMEIGGGGDTVHAHDGPHNVLHENYARVLRVLKRADRDNRLSANWHVEPLQDLGSGTSKTANQAVPAGWDAFPFAPFCGHEHSRTAETARPG